MHLPHSLPQLNAKTLIKQEKIMNTAKQKILDKVIKLLTLAEGTSFTEESATARNMAAELMARYDIQEADTQTESEFIEDTKDLTRKKLKKAEVILINSISIFNGVAFIRQEWGVKGKITFVGKQSDLDCNEYMLDIIRTQRTQMWKNHISRIDLTKSQMKKERELWMKGFSYGIASKLRELRTAKDTKIQEWGLVVVDKYNQALSEYEKENECTTSKSRPSYYSKAGYNSGKDASIHRGVNHSQSNTRQIG